MLIHDDKLAAHGDFLILRRARNGTTFEVAAQRLFTNEVDAIAALPKDHGYDFYVVQVVEQYRSAVTHHQIVDPRLPRLTVQR